MAFAVTTAIGTGLCDPLVACGVGSTDLEIGAVASLLANGGALIAVSVFAPVRAGFGAYLGTASGQLDTLTGARAAAHLGTGGAAVADTQVTPLSALG